MLISAGIPHCTEADDEYEGYRIPKGSIVHANFIAMTRDANEYPDPEAFNIDRWLLPEYPTYREPLTEYPNLKRYPAFGYGRRICPGLAAAENSLFIEIATVAWACHIEHKTDARGEKIPIPWYDFTAENNTAPKPFQFSLLPRDEGRIKILEAASIDVV